MALTQITGSGIGQVTNIKIGGSGSANTLDDYEEGTWTPSFTNVNSGATAGTYTKIGRKVFCTAVLQAGGTASFDITGLPFTALVGTGERGGGTVMYQNRDEESWQVIIITNGINIYEGAGARTLAGTETAFVSFTYITS
tara:strand:+ start:37 stop:456 length:420 start_codon:yes stop_codon:yes gene_type:complete